MSPTAINREVGDLSHAYTKAIEYGDNPISEIVPPVAPGERQTGLTQSGAMVEYSMDGVYL